MVLGVDEFVKVVIIMMQHQQQEEQTWFQWKSIDQVSQEWELTENAKKGHNQ